jgi:uncharacterized SAM-dependent methyltransferase
VAFLRRLYRLVAPAGGMLIGVDLKKERAVLERAYDDAAGVTAAFNLNLLERINRELGADFDLQRWTHRALYDERAGRIEMHVVSAVDQRVTIADRTFAFGRGETIRTEVSYKYALEDFARLAGEARLAVDRVWLDRAGRFSLQWLTPRT